jgi:hypothetical protein
VRVSNSISLSVLFMAAPHDEDQCRDSLTGNPFAKVRNTSETVGQVYMGLPPDFPVLAF